MLYTCMLPNKTWTTISQSTVQSQYESNIKLLVKFFSSIIESTFSATNVLVNFLLKTISKKLLHEWILYWCPIPMIEMIIPNPDLIIHWNKICFVCIKNRFKTVNVITTILYDHNNMEIFRKVYDYVMKSGNHQNVWIN